MKKWKVLHDSDRQSENSKSKASLNGNSNDKTRSKQYLPLKRSKIPSLIHSKNSSVTHSQIFLPHNLEIDKYIKCQTNSFKSNESRSNLTTHRKPRNSQNFDAGIKVGTEYFEDEFRLLPTSLQYIQNQQKEKIEKEKNLRLSQRITLKDKQKMERIKIVLKRGQKSVTKQDQQHSGQKVKFEEQKTVKELENRQDHGQRPRERQQKILQEYKNQNRNHSAPKSTQLEIKPETKLTNSQLKDQNEVKDCKKQEQDEREEKNSLRNKEIQRTKIDTVLKQVRIIKEENKACIKQIKKQLSSYSQKIRQEKTAICRQVASQIKIMQEEYYNSKVQQIFDQYYTIYKPKIGELDLQKQKLLQQLIKLSPL